MEEYTTSRNVTIKLIGLPSMLLAELMVDKTPPPPTYTVMTAAGVPEEHAHDETTLDNPDDPEETQRNHEAWQSWLQEKHRIEAEHSERMTKVIVLKGIDFELPTGKAMDEWLEEMEFLGVQVPEKRLDRKYFYIMHEVVGGPDDINAIMTKVMGLSGVPAEMLELADSMFQRAMEEATTKASSQGT